MKFLTVITLLALTLTLTECVVVCYLESWAVYRSGNGKFDVGDIDTRICSHLIFAFAGLNSTGQIQVLDPFHELCENGGECAYDRFTALKEQNPALVTLLSVGGWNEGSTNFSKVAGDPALRKTFVDTSLALLKEHGFDGIDIDWEYPTQRGGVPEDKENFVTLLSEFREALHAENMTLTAALAGGKFVIDEAYDIPGIAEQVDIANIMTYDFHGVWENFVHHASGLTAYSADTDSNTFLNADFAITYWIEGGMPSTKIAMGVPLYATCWTLDDPTQTDYYSPASNPGQPGPWTESEGTLAINELCYSQTAEPDAWVIETAAGMNEPHTYRDSQWCSYENRTSAGIKANYAKNHNLAGVMVWSIDMDDFQGNCYSRTFELTRIMFEVLGRC
ncbi:acidic mammalian chitinase [Procambarus clarkii]|uniref:acidic mammalian chitinase n=1 Tax=Procambarus clarkii TaxID=6728 RepID=UPI00374460D6